MSSTLATPGIDARIARQTGVGACVTATVKRASLRLLEQEEQKLSVLQQALIDGERSGDAGELDGEDVRQKARENAGLSP